MAKWNRKVVGSFIKSKDATKPPYLKFKEEVTIKEGQFIRVENKKFQETSLQQAIASGKLSEEIGEKALARLEKMPDFVLADLVILSQE